MPRIQVPFAEIFALPRNKTIASRTIIALLLLLLLLLPHRVGEAQRARCLLNLIRGKSDPLNYYKPGDYVVGGLSFPRHVRFRQYSFSRPPSNRPKDREFQSFSRTFAFVLAIHEVNQNPKLLSNITLGYNIEESYSNNRMATDITLDLLSDGLDNIPNYSCGRRKNLLAVIEGEDSDLSGLISTLLSNYKIPQISFGSLLKAETQLPFVFRMAPWEEAQYPGIIKLLLHFGWTWIGLFFPESEKGQRFVNGLTNKMIIHGICVAFAEIFQQYNAEYRSSLFKLSLNWTKVNVFLFYGTSETDVVHMYVLQMVFYKNQITSKLWITTVSSAIDVVMHSSPEFFQFVHGSLSFGIKIPKSSTRMNFNTFSSATKESNRRAFHCFSFKHKMSVKTSARCIEENLETLPQEEHEKLQSQDSYGTYNSVQAVAQALRLAYTFRSERSLLVGERNKLEFQRMQPWQFHSYLRSLWFSNTSLVGLYMDKNGEIVTDFDIVNWVLHPNKSGEKRKIGNVKGQTSPRQIFTIDPEAIVWPGKGNKAGGTVLFCFVLHPQMSNFSIKPGLENVVLFHSFHQFYHPEGL